MGYLTVRKGGTPAAESAEGKAWSVQYTVPTACDGSGERVASTSSRWRTHPPALRETHCCCGYGSESVGSLLFFPLSLPHQPL